MRKLGIAVAMVFGLLLVQAPAHATTYASVCSQQTWTGKDPRACKGTYTLYEVTANRPRMILQVHNHKGTDWKAIQRGYRAAEDWCKDSPLACTVVTSVGVSVVLGWLGPATS